MLAAFFQPLLSSMRQSVLMAFAETNSEQMLESPNLSINSMITIKNIRQSDTILPRVRKLSMAETYGE